MYVFIQVVGIQVLSLRSWSDGSPPPGRHGVTSESLATVPRWPAGGFQVCQCGQPDSEAARLTRDGRGGSGSLPAASEHRDPALT